MSQKACKGNCRCRGSGKRDAFNEQKITEVRAVGGMRGGPGEPGEVARGQITQGLPGHRKYDISMMKSIENSLIHTDQRTKRPVT